MGNCVEKIIGSAEKNGVGRGTGITGFVFGLIILSLPYNYLAIVVVKLSPNLTTFTYALAPDRRLLKRLNSSNRNCCSDDQHLSN